MNVVKGRERLTLGTHSPHLALWRARRRGLQLLIAALFAAAGIAAVLALVSA